METYANGYWMVISFTAALLFMWWILRKSNKETTFDKSPPIKSLGIAIWSVNGVLLAFISQSIALKVERFLGIKTVSENTQFLVNLVGVVPLVIFVIVFLAPIIEEIVFRKIIFGTLYNRMNFFWAALISSTIFAIVHFDFKHILTYAALGFAFAYVYKVTKQICVPIIAHVVMNAAVIVVQTI